MVTDANFVVKKGLNVQDGDISIKGSNKELRFYEGSNYVGFEAPALSADKIWVLPAADGSTGQVLKTDGSGNLGWVSVSGGASLSNDANNRIVTADGSGGINGEANLTFDGSTLALAGKQTITVADTVTEAFKVTITDTDSTADSTPFVVDGDGRVGIGTASPVSGLALTLNGDGSNYEGLAFQSGGSTKFKQTSDGSAFYFDSAINTGNVNFRVKDSGGNLRPALGIEGSNFSVAVGYNGTSGSSLNPKNTFQVNVGTESGVQDNDDGVLLLNSDLSITDGDKIAGIGFATRDGNIPSVTTEAAAAIVAYAAEDHSTGDKGGDLAFLTASIDDDDDTASTERMRIKSTGQVVIGTGTQPIAAGQLTVVTGDDDESAHTLLLMDNEDDATRGPIMTMYRNTASPAAGDRLGSIRFNGEDGAGFARDYAKIEGKSVAVGAGSHTGQLIFSTTIGASITDVISIDGTTGGAYGGLLYNQTGIKTLSNSVSATSTANDGYITLLEVPHATFKAVKASIHITDSSSNEVQTMDLICHYDGSAANYSNYGIIYDGDAPIGDAEVDINSNNIRIRFQNTQGSTVNLAGSIHAVCHP